MWVILGWDNLVLGARSAQFLLPAGLVKLRGLMCHSFLLGKMIVGGLLGYSFCG